MATTQTSLNTNKRLMCGLYPFLSHGITLRQLAKLDSLNGITSSSYIEHKD